MATTQLSSESAATRLACIAPGELMSPEAAENTKTALSGTKSAILPHRELHRHRHSNRASVYAPVAGGQLGSRVGVGSQDGGSDSEQTAA